MVSAAIGQLEEELGVPLFERHARGLSAKPDGITLYHRAVRLLAEADALAQAWQLNLRERGIRPHIKAQVENEEWAQELAAARLGLTVMPTGPGGRRTDIVYRERARTRLRTARDWAGPAAPPRRRTAAPPRPRAVAGQLHLSELTAHPLQ